ncbi:RNA polymerase sigma-70 factor [Pedobacter sp.]|jgi:RNA polymerase sigma-70 factor (family 1)|uniref:RNA polymerase sigma factor n=1 Tax=Pedobacter sp. TaxID=1411316 RepID=UPI002C5DBB02|nr:RNA polymerase sigma-70 factor [Pedobacter sp.]HWW41944.1 RNA polymerase sigma-70 factor [Pedobacter sp.]
MGNLKELKDEELILLLNQSDERALVEIYDRYWNKLLAQARWDLRDEADAEDCIQELFIKLWNCRTGLTLRYKLSTYLYRAVKNQTINMLAKRNSKRNNIVFEEATGIEIFAPSADSSLLEKEMLQILEAAIDSLPEKCSKIYRMSRIDGQSNKEIARQLDVAEKTVEGHITRAIKQVSTYISLSILVVLISYFLYR